MPKKDTLQLQIKNIPLEVETEGLGMVELMDLVGQVEEYMNHLDTVDTLKQALATALHFAIENYKQTHLAGGKQQEEISRVNDLILKLQHTLSANQA